MAKRERDPALAAQLRLVALACRAQMVVVLVPSQPGYAHVVQASPEDAAMPRMLRWAGDVRLGVISEVHPDMRLPGDLTVALGARASHMLCAEITAEPRRLAVLLWRGAPEGLDPALLEAGLQAIAEVLSLSGLSDAETRRAREIDALAAVLPLAFVFVPGSVDRAYASLAAAELLGVAPRWSDPFELSIAMRRWFGSAEEAASIRATIAALREDPRCAIDAVATFDGRRYRVESRWLELATAAGRLWTIVETATVAQEAPLG